MTLLAIVTLLLSSLHTTPAQTRSTMQSDVDRLVRVAEQLSGTWPAQPPPPIPEVAVVAAHGRPVVPLLMPLLSDDPNIARDRKRWHVQQQVALTLTRIYRESAHCGRTYCDGDPTERIAGVRTGWLQVIASDNERRALSLQQLLDRFTQEKVFWRQFDIAQALAATNNRSLIVELESWLTHDDRHLRGNAAFVLGRLGDPRGFETIAAILADRSTRSAGQGMPGGNWTERAQIRADRYYAAHLLGDLRDPRGVDVLVPLLTDADVASVVPWALAEIGDRRAIGPLVGQLEQDDPSRRVLAILALETLQAHEALPRLQALLQDSRTSTVGTVTSVVEAARHAIAVISQRP
jgi:hypothetical protein